MKRILNLAAANRASSQTLPAVVATKARAISAARLEQVRPEASARWSFLAMEETTSALAERAYYRVQRLGAHDKAPRLNRTV